MITVWFLCATICTLAWACTPSMLDEAGLQAYVLDADNGLRKEKEANGIDLSVYYRPSDMVAAQHLKGMGGATTKATADSLAKHYGNYAYFVLGMAKDDKDVITPQQLGHDAYSEMVQVLSFRMGQYVYLTLDGQDTIPVADYTYPRFYGMAGESTLMFSFKKPDWGKASTVRLCINEFGLGTGNLRFAFEADDLEKVPELTFDTSK